MNNFLLGQVLYAPTKTGNTKTWSCEVIDEGHFAILIIKSQTKLGGKEVVRQEEIKEGKNIGKSNETTPYKQAISEAESRYRKKIDQGYQAEIPENTSQANSNALGFPLPMLAHPIDKVKEIRFPAYFQPKLDGHRAIVTKQNGKMIIYSRRGKLITTMDHILDHLESKVDEGVFLDGELYLHGEALQNIGSLIKRRQKGSEEVVYHMYDIINSAPYAERYQKLFSLVGLSDLDWPVQLVMTNTVNDMDDVNRLTDLYLKEGYEGGILRLNGTGYEAGFKSRSLLKIKKFDDSEAEIIGMIQCKDFTTNGAELKVAKFVCRHLETGAEFDCTVFGSMEQKDAIYHDKEKYIGKILTVKHSGYTVAGTPFHPVALRLREDI